MHDQVIEFVRRVAAAKGLDQDPVNVLDIGGRKVSTDRYYQGPQPAELFPNAAYDILDLVDGPDVSILADATRTWTIPPWTHSFFDVVICTEVLEHVKDWVSLLATAHQVMRPGGTLILTCAGPGRPPHAGFHEFDEKPTNEFYANVEHLELRKVLEFVGFRDVITFQVNLDTQAVATR